MFSVLVAKGVETWLDLLLSKYVKFLLLFLLITITTSFILLPAVVRFRLLVIQLNFPPVIL